jgi:hypothetical protein
MLAPPRRSGSPSVLPPETETIEMSVATAQVVQIAHKKKTQINDFLRKFKAGTAFRAMCRDYSPLDGCESKIVKEGSWYMTTVVFSATNWDSDKLLERFGDDYLVQVGIIDDRQSDSNVLSDDETEHDERFQIFGFHFPF